MEKIHKRMTFNYSALLVPRPLVAVFSTGFFLSLLLGFSAYFFFTSKDGTAPVGQGIGYTLSAILLMVYVFMVVYAYVTTNRARGNHLIAKEHSEMPWMWKEEWRDGCIEVNTSAGISVLLIIGTFVGLLATPFFATLTWGFFDSVDRQKHLPILLQVLTVIPIVAYFALLFRLNKYRSKVGLVKFYVDSIPVSRNGFYEGKIVGLNQLKQIGELEITLICQEIRTEKGKKGVRKTLWENSQIFEVNQSSNTGELTLPFHFVIPDDLPETNYQALDAVEWILKVRVEDVLVESLEQLAIKAEVPVFFEGYLD